MVAFVAELSPQRFDLSHSVTPESLRFFGEVLRAIFDNAGGVSNAVDYDAFGGILSGVNVDRYSWTGREADSLTGLRHNRAREYDPAIGRWTSEDPIGFAAGDVNLFRYVGNEATGAVDPSGYAVRTSGIRDVLVVWISRGDSVDSRMTATQLFVPSDWQQEEAEAEGRMVLSQRH